MLCNCLSSSLVATSVILMTVSASDAGGAVAAAPDAGGAVTAASPPPAASLKDLCQQWRSDRNACALAAPLMLVSCAGVCSAHEVSCSRPPPADYEHELCAKLAARGECWSRPPSFLAQCFRACAMDDPEKVLEALLAESAESIAFPTDGPTRAAAHLGAAVPITADGHTLSAELLHAEPRVLMLRDVITDDEARAIIRLAKPLLSASPTHTGEGYRPTTRSSSSAVLLDDAQPPLRAVRLRLANLTGYPEANFEPLQLVRYLPGQEYEPHNDWFDACDVREHLRGGERRLTILIYLNAIASGGGGATNFPELEVRVPPTKRGAVLFENYALNATRGDGRCLHQGEPPSATTKFAANVWVRARRFRL
jgi:prolyl 4-hydroxylase